MKYFFQLWYRNAKGVFFNGLYIALGKDLDLSDTHWSVIILILPLHILTLPLTLTLGAGIKSLIDYFSRNFSSKNEVELAINGVDSHQNVEELLPKNRDAVQSNSSQILLKSLALAEHNLNKTCNNHFNKQKTLIKSDYVNQALNHIISTYHSNCDNSYLEHLRNLYKSKLESDIPSPENAADYYKNNFGVEFDSALESNLNSFLTKHAILKSEHKNYQSNQLKENINKQKASHIKSFLSEPKNNGKKTFEHIVAEATRPVSLN